MREQEVQRHRGTWVRRPLCVREALGAGAALLVLPKVKWLQLVWPVFIREQHVFPDTPLQLSPVLKWWALNYIMLLCDWGKLLNFEVVVQATLSLGLGEATGRPPWESHGVGRFSTGISSWSPKQDFKSSWANHLTSVTFALSLGCSSLYPQNLQQNLGHYNL